MDILERWDITSNEITGLLDANPSLRGMLFGYVAELKLRQMISVYPDVSHMTKFDDHDRKKKGDLYVIYKGRAFDVESKSLQTNSIVQNPSTGQWFGKAQVDASDRRTITLPDGSTMNTTLLLRGEFDILAVNCYAFEEKWHFVFAKNSDLPCSTYSRYTPTQQECLIASLIPVSWPPSPPFVTDIRILLDEMVEAGEGRTPDEELFRQLGLLDED